MDHFLKSKPSSNLKISPFCTAVFTTAEGRTKGWNTRQRAKDEGRRRRKRAKKHERTKEDKPRNLVHLHDVFHDPDFNDL
jgi:hypothetical protein